MSSHCGLRRGEGDVRHVIDECQMLDAIRNPLQTKEASAEWTLSFFPNVFLVFITLNSVDSVLLSLCIFEQNYIKKEKSRVHSG